MVGKRARLCGGRKHDVVSPSPCPETAATALTIERGFHVLFPDVRLFAEEQRLTRAIGYVRNFHRSLEGLSKEKATEVALGFYNGAAWLRIAAQAYNAPEDYALLRSILEAR